MRLDIQLLAVCLAALGVNSQQVKDGCPKDEYACLDVINSSQCLGQLVEQNSNTVNADSLAKCVVYDGTVTSLPGGTKLCRCAGCHTPLINAAITKYFPPPCA